MTAIGVLQEAHVSQSDNLERLFGQLLFEAFEGGSVARVGVEAAVDDGEPPTDGIGTTYLIVTFLFREHENVRL